MTGSFRGFVAEILPGMELFDGGLPRKLSLLPNSLLPNSLLPTFLNSETHSPPQIDSRKSSTTASSATDSSSALEYGEDLGLPFTKCQDQQDEDSFGRIRRW